VRRCDEALKVSFILCLLLAPAFGQRQIFKYYGQQQGLSNLATECLLQDRAGFLWVGTQNGLFRYDGAVFTQFGRAEGLPSSPIDALAETPDGVLWVGTSLGLAKRRGSRFEDVSFGRRVKSPGLFGLAADRTGRLYLSTIDGLLVSTPAPRTATGGSNGFAANRQAPRTESMSMIAARRGSDADQSFAGWQGKRSRDSARGREYSPTGGTPSRPTRKASSGFEVRKAC
jgi:hypothetical protein